MGERESWVWRHRRELRPVWAMALAWALSMTLWGPENPVPLAVILLVGVPVGIAYARWQHPRSRIVVVGGSIWPWRWSDWRWRRQARSDLRAPVGMWEYIAERAGIHGAKLRKVVADPDEGYCWHVTLAHGDLGTKINLPAFHSAVRLPVHWIVTTPAPDRLWEIVISELPEAVADELHDDVPLWTPPSPVDLETERLERLRQVAEQLGPEVVSAADLGRRAGDIPRDWMARHITKLAPQLGLRRAKGGWVRLAMAVGEER